MLRAMTWVFAGLGSLGLFDWVVAGIIVDQEPGNRYAQAAAGGGWLYLSMLSMALGLALAWLSGAAGDETQNNSKAKRIARHLKLVK